MSKKSKKTTTTETTATASAEPTPSVTTDELVAMAESRGLTVEEQASFYKVSRDRKAVYISKSKRGVGRIDLSGFEMDHPAISALTAEQAKEMKLGKVRGQIMPARTPDGWLEAYEASLDRLCDGSEGYKLVRKPKGEGAEASA
jgi:hypothetical protein